MISLLFSAAPDPRRRLALQSLRIVKPGCGQVTLKEPAQIIAPAIEAQLDTTPIDGGFHLGWTTEGQRDVRTAGILFGHRPLDTTEAQPMKSKIRKLSLSVPGWMKPLIRKRAEQLDLTVSQYVRRLVSEEKNSDPIKVDG